MLTLNIPGIISDGEQRLRVKGSWSKGDGISSERKYTEVWASANVRKCTQNLEKRRWISLSKNGPYMNRPSYLYLSERRGGLSTYLPGQRCLIALWHFKFVQLSKMGLPRSLTAMGIMSAQKKQWGGSCFVCSIMDKRWFIPFVRLGFSQARDLIQTVATS